MPVVALCSDAEGYGEWRSIVVSLTARKIIMQPSQSRRRFLTRLLSADAASVLGVGRSETTTIRLSKNASICVAPQFVAGELLRAEGFYRYRLSGCPTGINGRSFNEFRRELKA